MKGKGTAGQSLFLFVHKSIYNLNNKICQIFGMVKKIINDFNGLDMSYEIKCHTPIWNNCSSLAIRKYSRFVLNWDKKPIMMTSYLNQNMYSKGCMISSAKSPYLPHAVDIPTAGGRTFSGQTENLPENEGCGFSFVKFAEACGDMGAGVTEPDEIKITLKRKIQSAPPVKLMVWERFLKGAMSHPFISTGSTGFQDI
jgi:hypothetical protein